MGDVTCSLAGGIARLELANPPYNCITIYGTGLYVRRRPPGAAV